MTRLGNDCKNKQIPSLRLMGNSCLMLWSFAFHSVWCLWRQIATHCYARQTCWDSIKSQMTRIYNRESLWFKHTHKRMAELCRVQATKVWEAARHGQMAPIGNMNGVYSKITTVWPGWWLSHSNLAVKPDGLAAKHCGELLLCFGMQT